jgi:DNA polymerase
MTTLYLDLETYSEVPITNGTHAYAEKAEVMLFAWAIDDGPVKVWDCTQNKKGVVYVPIDLCEALEDPEVLICAHNSHFDRTVLRHAAPCKAARMAAEDTERWRDTMVKALAHSLPGALGSLCEILDVPVDKAKDKEGRQLIMLFCKPRPATSKIRRATRETHPAEWAKFVTYAGLDIEAMRVVDKKLPSWNYQGVEMDLWHLDQRINDRGVLVDLELANAAIDAAKRAQESLAEQTQALTDGQVQAATQRDALLSHILKEYGVDLPDMQTSTLERRIEDQNLPPAVRELLMIRLQASRTSTSKYATLVKATSSDGRLRGLLQFDGANRTGRWAGRLFQPQNLSRPDIGAIAEWYGIPIKTSKFLKLKSAPGVEEEHVHGFINTGIEAMKAGCADLLYKNVMALAASSVRGCLVAPRGKKLVISDLANIEGRDAAWIAGEKWKLQAFRAYDAGEGPDLYKLAYAKSFNVKPDEVNKPQRQIGKVQELMLQYEGGVGAYLTGALTYGIDLEEMAEQAIEMLPADLRTEAEEFLVWTRREKRSTYGLSDQAFVVCDAFKRGWRYAHPAISSIWKELKEAAQMAVQRPGVMFECRSLKLRRDGAWLRIMLPSGRYLCYPSPQVDDRGQLSYMGVNQYSRKWCRLKTYGGKLFENVCQAVARDVLAYNMPRIEAAGYQLVLTVHDEVITEAPDSDEFNDEHLGSLLAANPPWAQDMPLAAGGFTAYRYRKD